MDDGMGKFHRLEVHRTHPQDRVDELFRRLKDAIAEYCALEEQEAVDLLDQAYYRLHEAEDWWERWKGE
jgi:hypothetical protein